MVLKELHGLIDGHIQYVCNALATETDFQCFSVVSLATAFLARYHHIGEEVHLNALVAIARAGLASSTLHIEGEATGLVASDLGLGKIYKKITYIVEHIGVCSRVAPRCTSQWSLVNIHHLVYILQTFDRIVWQRVGKRTIEVLRENGVQSIVNQSTLTRTAHTCDADEFAKREGGRNILEVITLGSVNGNALTIARTSYGGNIYLQLSRQITTCQCVCLEHVGVCTLVHNMTSSAACPRTDVYNPVGILHHFLVVFYHNYRVAYIAQGLQRGNESAIVLLMQTDGRFVQDVKHINQLRAYLGGQSDTLTLSTTERNT